MFHSVLHQQEVQDVRGKHCKPSTGVLTVGPREQITSIREWIHFTVIMQHKSNASCISKGVFILLLFFFTNWLAFTVLFLYSKMYLISRKICFYTVGWLPSTEGKYEFKLTLCYYIIFYFLCYVEVLLYLTFFGSCKSPGDLNLEGHELYSAMLLCK